MTVQLVGSSWGHTRGHDPLVAASSDYARSHDVAITWTPRSLTEFGVLDVGDLARRFDLVVIDHPHIGEIAEGRSLAPLDAVLGNELIERLSVGSPGGSHHSYAYAGHQWAFAIDASCHVAVWRDGITSSSLPATWDDVAELARQHSVIWPLHPVDAQASFLTIAASMGAPFDEFGAGFVPPDVGIAVLERMHSVARHLDPSCFSTNAIAGLEALAADDGRAYYCPLVFGYTNYSRPGYRSRRLVHGAPVRFTDARLRSTGSLLGGVGLGVSASSDHVEPAAWFASWLASASAQSGVFLAAGGQPAHPATWRDEQANAMVGGFFEDVRETIDGAWMRPRRRGYISWQNASLEIIHRALREGDRFDEAVSQMNRIAEAAVA